MAQKTIDLCNKATELNYRDKLRNGNIIELPSEGRLVVTSYHSLEDRIVKKFMHALIRRFC